MAGIAAPDESPPPGALVGHPWLKEVARTGLAISGIWGGIALIWFTPALAPGGWAVASTGLWQLVRGAFGAVHAAAGVGQKTGAALLVIVAALHFMIGVPVLGFGLLAAILAGRGERLREGLEWFL